MHPDTSPSQSDTSLDSETNSAGVVMILDDEPMVTASLSTMLTLDTPHRIFTFNHPADALAELETIQPDVVISDFLMPDMNGIAFLTEVRRRYPEITLMLLTGYADKENAIQAINQVGIYRYIEKPWDNDGIRMAIDNGLERARLLSELRKAIAALQVSQAALQAVNENLSEQVAEQTRDIRQLHSKLQSIIANTADGILTLDPHERITSANPCALAWIQAQYQAGNLTGFNTNSLNALTQGKDIDAPVLSIHHILVRSKNTSAPVNSDKVFEPGRLDEAYLGQMPVEVSMAELAGNKPKDPSNGYVMVLRDITQRKHIERLRDDFVSTLTHDLRTPLLASIQTLGLLLDGTLGPLTHQQSEILAMLSDSHRDLLGLVNALLEVYKYEAGKQLLITEHLDLGRLLTTIVNELNPLAHTKQQTLTLSLPESLPGVKGDKQELKRVFVNLIGNAIAYTQPEGRIQVTAEVRQGNEQIQITVKDNGRGIPASDLPNMFQRFSQGTQKNRTSGSGLGLYLSRQIVEAHHGRIGVDSTEGQGSRFWVLLPV